MPYADVAKNAMLTAEHIGTSNSQPITHVGLFTEGASQALTTPFAVAASDQITKTAHGLATNDLIVFTAITGGTGIILGHPYFVRSVVDANTFTLSGLAGTQPLQILDFTTDATAGSYIKLTEVTGGAPAYARTAIAWNTAVSGTIDDSTNGANALNVPAGTTVSYVGFFSHVSNSIATAGVLRGIQDVTNEVFAAQGTYTVTDADGLAPD